MIEIPQGHDPSSPEPLEGGVPTFMGSPVLDTISDMVLKLAAELWIVKNRLRLLESVLSENGNEVSAKLEAAYREDQDIVHDRQELAEFINRIFEEAVSVGARGVDS